MKVGIISANGSNSSMNPKTPANFPAVPLNIIINKMAESGAQNISVISPKTGTKEFNQQNKK